MKLSPPTWRRTFTVAAVLLVVTGGGALGAIALADGGSRADLERTESAAGKAPPPETVKGQTFGGACRMGYDTEQSALVPPDDDTADNPAAAAVKIKKTCAGAVTGLFTVEVSAPDLGDYVHLDMRATCVAKKHLKRPCTPGDVVLAGPGHTYFDVGPSSVHVGSAQMVWPDLPRGLWRFEVLPGGDGTAELQFRSFVVTAYNGG